MHANQGVNQVCPGTNIQDGSLLGDRAVTIVGEKIGKVMNVISTARNRRTEKAFRDIPVRHTVKMRQQRLVQGFHRQRIGKVNRRFTRGGLDNIVLQRRTTLAQCVHVVAAAMAISWVQSRLLGSHGILL